ncbi:MFS transporter [Streptomyces sp. NBC_01477]|uniref:MFS transporter n=1 Tax=Streptomyces sp. NBC_01477 TaxID=2976015 RepID=UPI002E311131|nr:MFS transporter [Streptomyces sp. NBC_01477]
MGHHGTRRRGIRRYLCGAAAARTGDEMSGPALLLAGLAATGSATTASSLLAGLTVSAAVGGPVFGVLLDRSARPGRLLARALGGYALALLVVLGCLGRAPLAVTLPAAVCAGLAGPALSGGWTSQLPRVVTGEALPGATALDAMTYDLASLAGPALAGVTAGLAGAPAGVLVAAALICLAVPSALALPGAGEAARGSGAKSLASGLTADLAAGFRAVARSRTLARATATSVISCTGQGMLLACVPLLGERCLGGAGHGALLLSGTAASGLAANAFLARRPHLMRPDSVVRHSALVLAAALLLAAAQRPAPLVVAMLMAGAAEGPQLTALFAVRHREAPAHLRARIFTTGASLKITGFGLGAGVAGPIAAWSLTGALLTAAGVQLLAAAAGFAPRR